MCKRVFFAAIFILAGFSACQTFNPNGEPPTGSDAVPPQDYNPIFITQVQPYNDNIAYAPKAEVSSVDVRDPNSVKLKVHITDTNNVYLSGLSAKKYQKYWCEIYDTIGTKVIKPKKFKIYEITENDNRKTYISVVMDHSGSMGEQRAVTVQNAISNLIQTKKDNDALALIKYDNKIITEVPLTTSGQILINGFKKEGLYNFGGMTAINDGIAQGLKQLENLRRTDDKAVIVFTDGWDNSSTISKDSVMKLAKKSNAIICAVDFGEDINKDFMKQYSDSTGGIYRHIYRTEEFNSVFEDLYKRLKNSYIVEYNPAEYGLHRIRIKMCFPYDTMTAYTTFDNTPDIGSIGLLNVYFDFNKSTIQKESEDAINSVLTLLKAYPNMSIELRGHTDSLNSTNDPDYNLKLSQKRADAVKQSLVKMGISSERIRAIGLGSREPVASNDTDEGRAVNRRTEFIILKK